MNQINVSQGTNSTEIWRRWTVFWQPSLSLHGSAPQASRRGFRGSVESFPRSLGATAGWLWLSGVCGLVCKLLTCYNAAVRVLVITCLQEERARLQVSFELRYRPAGHGRTHGDWDCTVCTDSSRVTQTQHACLPACPRLTQKNSWPDD